MKVAGDTVVSFYSTESLKFDSLILRGTCWARFFAPDNYNPSHVAGFKTAVVCTIRSDFSADWSLARHWGILLAASPSPSQQKGDTPPPPPPPPAPAADKRVITRDGRSRGPGRIVAGQSRDRSSTGVRRRGAHGSVMPPGC